MEQENFNKWSVKDLREYLLQYDIIDEDIKGTGKNGNIIKSDLVHTAKKLNIKSASKIQSSKNKDKSIIKSSKSIEKSASKIKSPKSGYNINIGGKAYNDLYSLGYFKSLSGIQEIDEAILLELNARDLGKVVINKYVENIIGAAFYCKWLLKHYNIEEKIHCKDIVKMFVKYTYKHGGVNYLGMVSDATEKGYLSLLKYIYHTDLIIIEYTKYNLLMKSIHYNHIDIINFLLSNMIYAKHNLLDALYNSIEKNNYDVTHLLIENGADASNSRVLEKSAKYGNMDIIYYLTNKVKYDINTITSAYQTAAVNGHLDAVKYFISLGADIHTNDHHALKWSAFGDHVNVFDYLLSLEPKDHYDINHIFNYSAWHGALNTVKYLLSHYDIRASSINRAVIEAAVRRNGNVLHFLLSQYTIDTKTLNKALNKAARYGDLVMVKYLVQNGADIHHDNNTPLEEALHNCKKEVVLYLLDEGVRVDKAIHYSKEHGFDDDYLYEYKKEHT